MPFAVVGTVRDESTREENAGLFSRYININTWHASYAVGRRDDPSYAREGAGGEGRRLHSGWKMDVNEVHKE